MELIYENKYGKSYKVTNHSNPNCTLQVVIGTVGIFMTELEMADLLRIVRSSHEPCFCESCDGEQCNKIWTTSELIDTVIKVNEATLVLLEDLIVGTQFILNMNETLGEYIIK